LPRALVEWGVARSVGFSAVVSLGDALDVDFGDLLDYFATDYRTRAILLYVEQIKDARKFMSAARAAARAKPVVVVKSAAPSACSRAAAIPMCRPWRPMMCTVRRSTAPACCAWCAGRTVHCGRDAGAPGHLPGAAWPFSATAAASAARRGPAGRAAWHAGGLSGHTVARWMRACRWAGRAPIRWTSWSTPMVTAMPTAIEALLADNDNDALLVVNVPTAFSSVESARRP
jgi:acetyltransferase